MRTLNLVPKMRKKFKANTTDSNHSLEVAPNILDRNFTSTTTDTVHVGDITYIPKAEDRLFLAIVIDICLRKVVGWSMDDNMRMILVRMAIQQRNPHAGLFWHTDSGSQYASYAYKELLKEHEIVQSMRRKGNCWDNAVSESFFHSLKTELTHYEIFQTRTQDNQMIFEYIEIFYNEQRIHLSSNYLSPVEFEEKMLRMEMAA